MLRVFFVVCELFGLIWARVGWCEELSVFLSF